MSGTLTVLAGNNITVNQSGSLLTINAAGLPINSVTYSNLSPTNGITFTDVGGSVANVVGYTNGGPLTYTSTNSVTTTGTLTTNVGGVTASSTGTGTLGTTSIALGNSLLDSSVSYGATPLVQNVTSLSGSTGKVSFTGNTVSTTAAQGTLTIGNGINLLGSGSVTFCSGNSQTGSTPPAGGITDSGTTGMVISGNALTLIGKTISVTSLLSTYNTTSPITITSNGSVNFQETGSIVLGALTLGTKASGQNYITSTTGNISQSAAMSVTGVSSPISFTSANTGNKDVTLSRTNVVYSGKGNLITISASGNSSYVTNNDIYLGTVIINPSSSTPSSYDSQLNVQSTTGNIIQSSGSMYVWGNTTLTSAGSSGISLNNLGNNFGKLAVNATSTGNVSIIETASSSYTSVTANYFTANSYSGDIISSTGATPLSISGNTVLNANNITLNTAGSYLSGASGLIQVNAKGNATLVDSNLVTTIANGSSTTGNLTITNRTTQALLTDQGSTSGVIVGGIASFQSPSISFTGTNNTFGALTTQSSLSNVVRVAGNLVLVPGSINTFGNFVATGNISTSGIGVYSFSSLSLTAANVFITNEMIFSGSLAINSSGTINLSGLSNYYDLQNGGIVPVINGIPTNVSSGTYTAPNP